MPVEFDNVSDAKFELITVEGSRSFQWNIAICCCSEFVFENKKDGVSGWTGNHGNRSDEPAILQKETCHEERTDEPSAPQRPAGSGQLQRFAGRRRRTEAAIARQRP